MAQLNLIGKNILGYNVVEKLGSGAFGTVYKVVKSNAAGQYVRALKHITIPTEKQYNSVLNSMGGDVSKADNYFFQMLSNIVSEIKILNDLSEKNVQHIVRYYENDIIETDSPRRYDIYILMEYLTPLEDYIQSTDFSVRDVIKLGLDLLEGLKSCHNNGVIHRDIKDDNIFVSDKGEYKIGDFGVSKILKDSSKAESLKGTPNFLAPEVYLGKEGYTKSVDLYSLGIVLYRLLNYSRNPFLPCYPKQYFAQDEDFAFEERMKGKTPKPPVLGGNAIGNVITKAIAGSTERYQTAEEFIDDLEYAITQTEPEIFNEKIKISNSYFTQEPEEEQYGSTLGETYPNSILKNNYEENKNSSINSHLFESIGESLVNDVPNVEPITMKHEYDEGQKRKSDMSQIYSSKRLINDIPRNIDEIDEPNALDKSIISKFVFLMPIIILLVGLMVYFIIVPNIYGKVVSFIDWLFTNPQNILNTLRKPNVVLPKINSIIGMRIFWWIWLASFITSLFFVGKQLQSKAEPNSQNAILIKKEPYLMIQEVTDTLRQIKLQINDKQLDSLIYSVNIIEEKLSVESDFGYGNNAVINCENNIAHQIQYLVDAAKNINSANFELELKDMKTAIANINSLLRRRTELKKR